MTVEIWPGQLGPLGAHYDGAGTNFSVFSEVAERVELCLFDDDGAEQRVALPEVTADCWHGYVPGVGPGQRYGFRVHGPWAPEHGLRCNADKLLLDPYARAVDGAVRWGSRCSRTASTLRTARPTRRTARPRCPGPSSSNPSSTGRDDRPPRTPRHRTVIYEAHVRGLHGAPPRRPGGAARHATPGSPTPPRSST